MFEESLTIKCVRYLFDGYIAPSDAVTPGNKYTARGSELNGKCSKQANLLVTIEGENRYYRTIRNFSRLPESFNATHNRGYHFCINCLNDFCSVSKKQSL